MENAQLLKRIQESIKQNNKRIKIRRLISYTFAACATVALVIGFNILLSEKGSVAISNETELITGNLLNSEDIQLITGNDELSFQNDIEIQIDEEGKTKILQSDTKAEKTVDILKNKINKLVVPYGKRTQLTLSDGSKVWLNSGSVLEFPTQFSESNREIHLLSGEMYIEVTPDASKSFFVRTTDFNVRVLGTKFNISTYDDISKSVALLEGSVQLMSQDKSIQLHPNELAVLTEPGKFTTRSANVADLISWKDGYLIFNKTPVSDVLTTLARYYSISFSFENDIQLKNRTCSGKLSLSNDLDDVMNTIALLSQTRYTREDKKIYITNKNNTH